MKIIDHSIQCGDGEFSHSGDLGDTVFSLATVRTAAATGQPATFYLYPSPGRTTVEMTKERAAIIAPLIESQPYVKQVVWAPYAGSNLDGWRDHLGPGRHRTILRAHMGTHGINDPAAFETPWLTVPPKAVAKYVICRTSRAHGRGFPWRYLLDCLRDSCVFIGLAEEHAAFVAEFGPVSHYPTKDLLEVAQVLAGADAYIGVQTAAHAIAEGLGLPIIREAPHEDYLDNCQSMRANLLSVYEGETVWLSVIKAISALPYVQIPYRQAYSERFIDPFWVGDDGWHRYNFRDIVNGDPYQLQAFANLIKPNLIVDVGGFIGMTASVMHRIWPAAEVVVFEPNRDVLHLLGLNAPGARIIPAACHPTLSWLGYSRGRHWGDPGSNAALHQPSWEKVPAVNLQEAVAGRRIDLLKLDCEGGEWPILAALHCRPKVIVGEWHNVDGINARQRLPELLPDYELQMRRCDDFTGIFLAVHESAREIPMPAFP